MTAKMDGSLLGWVRDADGDSQQLHRATASTSAPVTGAWTGGGRTSPP